VAASRSLPAQGAPARALPATLFSARSVGGVVALAVLTLCAVTGAHTWGGVDLPTLTRDMAAVAGVHPLTGVLSALGVLLWAASAAIWLFAALVLHDRARRAASRFALCSGLLSAYLGLDDLFMVHERLAPELLGLPELAVHGAIAACTLAYLLWFMERLLRADAGWLLLALVMLGASMFVDAVLEPWMWRLGDWVFLIEDGCKWLGIVFWFAFCVARCRVDVGLRP